MAKLTDPDQLSTSVNATAAGTDEVEIQTGAKTIKLLPQGTLDDNAPGKSSGVTAKAFYSFLKEEWLNGTDSAILRRFKFPLKMIFEGSFIWVNGWAPEAIQTRDLIRDAGFQDGTNSLDYSCLVSLGSVDAPSTDQIYYTQASGFTQAIVNYDKTGELNENIDITAAGAKLYQKSFLRVEAKLYSEYNLLVEQGLSTLAFQAYSFPLSNGGDLKITTPATTYYDVNIDATVDGIADVSPYGDGTYPPTAGMKINYLLGDGFTTAAVTTYALEDVIKDTAGRWAFCTTAGTLDAAGVAAYASNGGTAVFVAYDGEELIGSTYYAFNRVVTCNGGTDRQAYAFMQWMLRRTTSINANDTATVAQRGFGAVNGEVAELLGAYVGDTLKPAAGVVLRGFNTNSTNNITHSAIDIDTGLDAITSIPTSTTEVSFPFVAAGNMNFSQNLDDEITNTDTFYTMYFEYITRTSGSYTMTVATGDTGNLTWASTDLDHIIVGDYINLTGFTTNTGNNGLYLVNTTGAGTLNATHQVGTTLITETATVQVDEDPFESPGAIIVNDDAGPTGISGNITATTIGFDFDYTNNVQGGRTADTDAVVRVVAQSLKTAEWIDATHTITKTTGQSIAVNSSDERNYENN